MDDLLAHLTPAEYEQLKKIAEQYDITPEEAATKLVKGEIAERVGIKPVKGNVVEIAR